jgi:hypothetical protein
MRKSLMTLAPEVAADFASGPPASGSPPTTWPWPSPSPSPPRPWTPRCSGAPPTIC